MLAQDLLAAAQLGVERDQGPLGQVRVEVGEEADGVGQADAVLERRAALVVDEHEGEPAGRVGRGERGDVALQQLALARAGGAGGQPVRAVAAQVHRRPTPAGTDADRGAPSPVRAVRPATAADAAESGSGSSSRSRSSAWRGTSPVARRGRDVPHRREVEGGLRRRRRASMPSPTMPGIVSPVAVTVTDISLAERRSALTTARHSPGRCSGGRRRR